MLIRDRKASHIPNFNLIEQLERFQNSFREFQVAAAACMRFETSVATDSVLINFAPEYSWVSAVGTRVLSRNFIFSFPSPSMTMCAHFVVFSFSPNCLECICTDLRYLVRPVADVPNRSVSSA